VRWIYDAIQQWLVFAITIKAWDRSVEPTIKWQ
jgi:hypothetical protein